MNINTKALALTFAVLEAAALLVFALLAGWLNWGIAWIELVADIYIGYDTTISGAVIGAVWGFFDGLVGGALIGWLYNRFAK